MKLLSLLATAGLCVCLGCKSDNPNRSSAASDTAPTNYPTPNSPVDQEQVAARRTAAINGANAAISSAWVSPEARILSILHAKNQEEIQIGQLAQERGVSDGAKRFGEHLVQDHTSLDQRVIEVADRARINLLDPIRTEELLAQEAGKIARPMDPVTELRDLDGSLFDRRFGEKMLDGHSQLIQIVQNARNTVRNPRVRELLDDTLPKLREHERMAREVANR